MSADQDESGKPPREEEAPPKEAASQGVRRDSDPPLRGSMADLEQELAQLLDDAPDEEDDDEEDDDAPLVPPVDEATFEKPDLEPFDSDSGDTGGSGYDSWGPKIDLSAEVPAEPPGLSPEEMKAALAAPGTAKDTGLESTTESGSKQASDSKATRDADSATQASAEEAAAREDARRDRNSRPNEDEDEDDDEGEGEAQEDEEPDSDVPDTRPSEADVIPTKRPAPPKATPPVRARVTSSSPPEAKGPFTPLRAVLVVLGVLAFIWLIRRPGATSEPVPPAPEPQPSAEAPEAELPAPTAEPLPAELEASPEPQADEPASDAAPIDSAEPPNGPDSSLLAGDAPLPFDRVAVISALGPFAIEAGRCRRKTDPPGRVMVNLVIAPSGKITSIATGTKHSGTKTEECILEKLRRAKLEPHSGGDQTIALPVQLK